MVQPLGCVNSRWDPNGAPLGFWNSRWALLVHPWGFVNSLRDPNGAPLVFCEFAVGPQWCALGVL